MTTPLRRILPVLTPTRLLTTAGARAEMPADFVAEAVRRLRILASLVLAISLIMGGVVALGIRPRFQVLPPVVHAALFATNVGLCVALLVVRQGHLRVIVVVRQGHPRVTVVVRQGYPQGHPRGVVVGVVVLRCLPVPTTVGVKLYVVDRLVPQR